jgi:hypothetical protein
MKLFMGIRNLLILYAIVAIFILLAVKAFAGPYLICDPNLNTEWYEVDQLDFVSGQTIPAETDGSVRLDLAPLAVDGSYDILIRACNIWGCSMPDVPFTFTKSPSPSEPVNPRLEP